MEKEIQDYEAVNLCLQGRCEYFGILVDRYKRLVYSLALASLKDPQLAEDASQEAFVKAYRHLASYNPAYKFSTWIARITTNTCTDFLRKRKETCPIDDALELADSENTPERQVMGRETRDRLKVLIENLDPKYKEPLMLYHMSGMKYEEIAEYMNVPISIVKNRIYRARKMLKKAMED
jgi:RNA polymerase sigma factor, sigma-70 family